MTNSAATSRCFPMRQIRRSWATRPHRFTADPRHDMPGPDIEAAIRTSGMGTCAGADGAGARGRHRRDPSPPAVRHVRCDRRGHASCPIGWPRYCDAFRESPPQCGLTTTLRVMHRCGQERARRRAWHHAAPLRATGPEAARVEGERIMVTHIHRSRRSLLAAASALPLVGIGRGARAAVGHGETS